MLRCDLCGEGHANGNCVPEGQAEEVNYAGNFQKSNPYWNTYSLGWKDHLNLKWRDNQGQNST